jgi:hypothetical protein
MLILIWSAGCASNLARKRLEGVAKGWCEMIRASQVIPVYPLTEDLYVGDVFLVQTPISEQAKVYREKGFLPLDDHLVRLQYTNFSGMYFNAYWKDSFGQTPHDAPTYTNSGAISNNQAISLSDAPLPRAAFPTYSFQASSGGGFNAAFPIEGIPVALSYLNSQQVNGSVTIADARTYGGDPGQLLNLLDNWAAADTNREELAKMAKNALPTSLFLRVVSRVYYARALDVSLQSTGSQGESGKGGVVNDVSLLSTNGTVNSNYTNLLNTLSSSVASAASTASSATQVGAAVKFVSASSSSVGMSQSFDRLLAIGYLGFDVQVDTNGDLSVPIPTFQHLERQINEPKIRRVHFGADANSAKIEAWLRSPPAPGTPTHLDQLRNYVGPVWLQKYGITYIVWGSQFSDIRSNVVEQFQIK